MVECQPRYQTILHQGSNNSLWGLSTCYWQILVTLDGIVWQASIEICNGFLTNIMGEDGAQSEGRSQSSRSEILPSLYPASESNNIGTRGASSAISLSQTNSRLDLE